MESNYIEFEYKPNMAFAPIKIGSFPFPPNTIPEPLNSKYLFIERIEGRYYLRHTQVQFFCMELASLDTEATVVDVDEDLNTVIDPSTGNAKTVQMKVSYLCAWFQSEARSLGYIYKGKSTLFLHMHTTDKKLSELSEQSQLIYNSAYCHTRSYLHRDNRATQEQINRDYLSQNNLVPVGAWEGALFKENFNSNPNMLSDDEFEMIFGRSR